MAHKFETSPSADPFSAAAHEVERHIFSSRGGYQAGASEELYNSLANAIVSALGDIGAQGLRHGLNDPERVRGLAKAVAAVAERVLLAYRGEVDPEPLYRAIEEDGRWSSLPAEAQDKLRREIGRSRQLEELALHALRIPDLVDLASSLGLQDHDDALVGADVYLSGASELPSPDTR